MLLGPHLCLYIGRANRINVAGRKFDGDFGALKAPHPFQRHEGELEGDKRGGRAILNHCAVDDLGQVALHRHRVVTNSLENRQQSLLLAVEVAGLVGEEWLQQGDITYPVALGNRRDEAPEDGCNYMYCT